MTDDTDPTDLKARARRAYQRTLAENPEMEKLPTTIDRDKLEQAIAELRLRDREVFLAARLDNMSYGEIAEQTGMSEAEVRKSVARALFEIHQTLHGKPVRRWRLWPF